MYFCEKKTVILPPRHRIIEMTVGEEVLHPPLGAFYHRVDLIYLFKDPRIGLGGPPDTGEPLYFTD